jgi:hypothetical protein
MSIARYTQAVAKLTAERNDARVEVERLTTDLRRSLQETWVAENARDEALAHVADARRIIEAVLHLCDRWDNSSDSNIAYAIREVMAIAGSGTRPTGDCGCDRHNSNHSHCYAGCDLSGCRMLGGQP